MAETWVSSLVVSLAAYLVAPSEQIRVAWKVDRWVAEWVDLWVFLLAGPKAFE
jgi:hypothetical protein